MKPVAVRNIPRTDPNKLQRLAELGVATIHEAQGRINLMQPYMRPVRDGQRIAGNAVTILAQPGDNWMIHVAIELAQPGDILVLGCTTENQDGFFGDLLMESCMARGIAGLVIDGGVRDVRDLRERGFPVWSKAICARGTVKETLGWVNVPIVCAGASVQPGDAIVADDDGVCVVPFRDVDAMIAAGNAREEAEALKRQQLRNGELSLDLYHLRAGLTAKGFVYVDNLEDLDK